MSFMYDIAKVKMLRGEMNIVNSPIFAMLVDLDVYNADTADGDMTLVPSSARIGTPVQVQNVSVSDLGEVSANNVVFPNVSGTTIEAVMLYRYNGDDASNYPVVLIDNNSTLTITPDGTDIVLNWGNGDGRIFGI